MMGTANGGSKQNHFDFVESRYFFFLFCRLYAKLVNQAVRTQQVETKKENFESL